MPVSDTNPSLEYLLRGPVGAPGLVFVTGLGGVKESWLNQVRHFSARYRVLTYNHRGIGRSQLRRQDVSMHDYAADLLLLLGALGLDARLFVGISFGGRVLQELALRWPARVDRMVLVATSSGGPLHDPGDEAAIVAMRGAASLSASQWQQRVVPALFGPAYRESHREQLRRLSHWWARNPQHPVALERQWQAYDQFDRWDDLPAIHQPVLVVHGMVDTLSPVVNGELLAERIPDARLARLPGVGHSPNVEAAQTLNHLIEKFLEEP